MVKVTRTFPVAEIAILQRGDLAQVATEHCLYDESAIAKLMENYPGCLYTVTGVTATKYEMQVSTFIENATKIE